MKKAIKTLSFFLLLPILLDAQLIHHTLSNVFDNVTESTIGDIDGDGDMDIFFNQGGNKWFEQVDINTNNWVLHTIGGSNGNLELLDVDNDNDLDFVVHKNGELEYYENVNSIGTEIISHDVFEFTTLGTWEVTSLVDLDNDGDLDFICDGIAWAENIDGNFTFTDEQLIYAVPESHTVSFDFNFVDWDGNGYIDIIANVEIDSNEDISQVLLIKNFGSGNFDAPEILIDSLLCYNRAFTRIADVDMDDDIDIILHRGPDDVVWIRNDGGVFSEPILINEYFAIPGDLEVVDINNDGLLDIFWCGHGGVFWKPNQGDFTFDTVSIALGPEQDNEATNKITFGDLDQDGDMDMLRMGRAIGDFPQEFSWYENTFPIIPLNIYEIEWEQVSIYPNPATDKIIVKNTNLESNNYQISFIGPEGHFIRSLNFDGNMEISIENIPSGVYFLLFQNSESKFTKPLIIIH